MSAYIAAYIVLICLSAFFSASEMCFSSANRMRLESAAEGHKALLHDVVLVPYLADELLEYVLHRDYAQRAAVAVRDHGHVQLLLAHYREQLVYLHAPGHEVRLVQQRAEAHRRALL